MSGKFDVAVVGGGIAGLTAAHHAALDGAQVVHFTGSGIPGGLVGNVGELEGFPAVAPVAAVDLALQMGQANTSLGVEVVTEDVASIDVSSKRAKRLNVGGDTFTARAVIAACGAHLKMLDVPGAARLVDKGVSQCAWCNGSLYRGKDVVVVGGGDSALQEALHLAKFATQVTVVTHGPMFSARQSLVDRAAGDERLAFRWETEVAEVLGDAHVTGIRLTDKTNGEQDDLACEGVFVYVGLSPNSAWLGGQIDLDDTGAIVTDDMLQSSVPGVFAAGAVRQGYRGRLTHAVGEATTAAIAAAALCRE
ncbi:MAG: NAD(P)/FAD-dependent oxidoreductase [Hyphomicrobiaceae bacterium]